MFRRGVGRVWIWGLARFHVKVISPYVIGYNCVIRL